MIKDILLVIWFFLPAGLANAIPIFAARIPPLKDWSYPLDAYITWDGKRILGDHKTIRGLVSGIFVAILAVYLQIYVYEHSSLVRQFISLDYTSINPILFGLLLAIGALGGDALKSFFKRRINIAPGKSWFPFDHIDYILGGIILTAFYIHLSLWQYILLCVIWTFIHIVATFVGYLLSLKDNPI